MAGDADNARLWGDADVWVSFDLAEVNPLDGDTAFGGTWELVGLLNGDDGFTESRSEDETDHYAWGGILIRTGRKNFKLTRSFTAFEANDTTFRLTYPGSTATAINVPTIERVKIAFETRDGTITRRLISTLSAEVVPDGDINENETDIASVAFVTTIFPTTGGQLFTVQESTPV